MERSNTKLYHLPSDAVWFITGCSSGIGQALAQFIAKSSNRLVATARNTASLSEITSTGDNILKLQLDVTSITSIEAALQATLEKFGRIDVLVNNAGYMLVGDTEAAGDEEARALMDTNFWGLVDVTKRVLPIMRDENPKNGGQQGGVIANVTSMGGRVGYPASSFYHASKFAVEGWSESLAKELPTAWNIHVCNVEPGGTNTNFATSSLKHMAQRHPAYADPSYPTNVIMSYILSEECRSTWAEPSALAAAIYLVLSRGERIPIQLPLGTDAWGMLENDLEESKKELEQIKDVSCGVGDPKQLKSVDFLKNTF